MAALYECMDGEPGQVPAARKTHHAGGRSAGLMAMHKLHDAARDAECLLGPQALIANVLWARGPRRFLAKPCRSPSTFPARRFWP